jgi:hypothetical protein
MPALRICLLRSRLGRKFVEREVVNESRQVLGKELAQLPLDFILEKASDIGDVVKSAGDVDPFQRVVFEGQSGSFGLVDDEGGDAPEF